MRDLGALKWGNGPTTRRNGGKLFVERRVDCVVRADENDRVTIWWGGECGLHADIPACADPVLDDEQPCIRPLSAKILLRQPLIVSHHPKLFH